MVGNTQVATLWNRYSSNCNANWARVQLTSAGLSAGDSFIVSIQTTDSKGAGEFMCFPGPSNTGQMIEDCSEIQYGGSLPAYTDMVDGTNLTTATLYVYDSSGAVIARYGASQ
jgi:hypothetical protein